LLSTATVRIDSKITSNINLASGSTKIASIKDVNNSNKLYYTTAKNPEVTFIDNNIKFGGGVLVIPTEIVQDTGFTIFLVIDYKGSFTNMPRYLSSSDPIPQSNSIHLALDVVYFKDIPSIPLGGSPRGVLPAPGILIILLTGSSNNTNLYYNNILKATQTNKSLKFASIDLGGWYNDTNENTGSINADYKEFIVFKSLLNDNNISTIYNYLNNKWNSSSSSSR
jgi:hypothetical protein